MLRKKMCRLISIALVAALTTGLGIPTALTAGAESASEDVSGYEERMTPIMGWSSWNEYANNISEEILIEQMDLMKEYGLIDLGYTYFNIDDGYQGGRDDKTGLVIANAKKFPNGMKYIADYAHSLGMKAGIYSDAGDNTCASRANGEGNSDYQNRPGTGYGIGVGLYQHEEADLQQYFDDWNFDFIKVDWCGGQNLGWNNEQRTAQYNKVGGLIENLRNELGRDLIYNVCCWTFPGEAVVNGDCDSWRVGGDLWANFDSILSQIDNIRNNQLWQYSSPGKANDLDMMQIGRGLTYEEDKTHFSMWCMMGSPLMIGADLTKIPEETLSILKNKEMIAIDQDPACIGAVYKATRNNVEIWSRDLGTKNSDTKAIALMNRSNTAQEISLTWEELDLYGDVTVRDLWQHKYLNVGSSYTVTIPAHGTVVWKVQGETAGTPAEMERSATVTTEEKPKSMNLTELGTGDWLHYGNVNGTVFRRKADVTPKLSYTGSMPSSPSSTDYYTDAYTSYSWSDGTESKSSGTTTGLTVGKSVGAFGQITAPSDERERTLYVPITAWNSTVQIDVSLGGKQMQSETLSPAVLYDSQPRVSKLVTVTYSSSVATTLTVTWTIVSQEVSNGNVAVEAAALTLAEGENSDIDETDYGYIGGLTARDRVENAGALLLDVRSATEYKAGHIAGAINLPYGEIFDRAAELLPNKEQEVIVYCLTGKRSTQARQYLQYLGYTNIYDLGSMEHWDSLPQLTFTNYKKMILPSTELTITVNGGEYDTTTLTYAIGEKATAADAVEYTGAFTLNKSTRVTAYLFYTDCKGVQHLVAQTSCDYLVFENTIPALDGLEMTYCSELTPSDSYVAYGTVVKDASCNNNALTMGGRRFEKGISAHAPSTVTYSIPSGTTRFVAAAGCDDEVGNQSFTIVYSILIDGKQIGQSIQMETGRFYVFDIPVPASASELTLVTQQGNASLHKNTNMHAEWGIAAFVQDPDDRDAKIAASVDAQLSALGTITSLAQKEAVELARAAYDALTDRQRLLVTGLALLEKAEAELAELEASATLPGDMDSDGNRTVSDVVLLRKAIVTGAYLSAGDMDADGALTVTDVVLLRGAIVHGEAAL